MSVTSAERTQPHNNINKQGVKKEMAQQTSILENNSNVQEELQPYKDPLMMTFTLGNDDVVLRQSYGKRDSMIISDAVTLTPTNLKSPEFMKESSKLKGDKIIL